MWVKNTNGRQDAMLTFAAISFSVVTLNVLLSSFDTITLANSTIVFKPLDTSVMGIYLGSTFTAYVSRRWTDQKYSKQDSSAPTDIMSIASSVVQSMASSNPEVALSQIEMQDPEATDEDTSTTTKRRKPRGT